jgi:radical SAM protein with 4Fe4S-binding SPASM domain
MNQILKLPNWIELSVIDSCNRACNFCPKSDKDNYPNQPLEMSKQVYTKLFHELEYYSWKGAIMICGYGEPLLYKDIYNLISQLSKLDCEIKLVTNGDFLNEQFIVDLFNYGLTTMYVSLYDDNNQVDYYHNLFKQVGIKNSKYELRERWERFGTITNRGGSIENTNCLQQSCYYPCYFTMIDWNGDVLICPQDWRKKVKFGNINNQSLNGIWTSNYYNSFRKNLLLNGRNKAPCKFCDTHGMKKGENEASLWGEYYV